MHWALEGRSPDRTADAEGGLRLDEHTRVPWYRGTPYAIAILAALLAGVSAFVVAQTGNASFSPAEWTWLLGQTGRSGAVILDPSDGSLAVVPLALTHLLWSTVGIDDHAPYRDLLLGAHLVLVAVVYAYAAVRRGPLLALLPAIVVLCLGAAWQNVLLPAQLGWVLSIAAGTGALLLLDRRHPLGDAVACVLLGVALASSATGLAVAVGLAVELLVRRRPRALWVVALPVLAYLAWWLRYQDGLPGTEDLLGVPWHVVVLAASTLSGAAGLTGPLPAAEASLGYGLPLLVVVLGLVAWLRPAVADAPRAWGLLAALLAFWIGAAATHGSIEPLDVGAYLTFGAVFGLLLALEVVPRAAPAPGVALGLAAVAVGIGLSGLQTLRGAAEPQRDAGILVTSQLAAVDLAAAAGATPTAKVRLGETPGVEVAVADYLRVKAAYGTPARSAASVAELKAPAPRAAADGLLLGLAGPALLPGTPGEYGATPPAVLLSSGLAGPVTGGCRNYRAPTLNLPGGTSRLSFRIPPGGAYVGASGSEQVTVAVLRFGADPIPVGTVAPEQAAVLRMPPAAGGPWTAVVGFTAGVSICGGPA